MCLPPTHTWTLKGTKYQHRVRSRWGSQGRINLIGTLLCSEGEKQLEYRVLEGSCDSKEVLLYLDALAERASPAKPYVVVLDNAPRFTRPVRFESARRSGRRGG